MEAEDVCNFLYGARCAREEFLSLLQAHLAVILFRAETDPLREGLSQMRIANPEFGGNRGQTETFLTPEGDECMGALDQLVDTPVESRSALQVADDREQVRSHG